MLQGKNAIITGANRGIGRAVMEEFARCGCGVWACARRESAEFEGRAASLSAECGVRIEPVYFDLTDKESIARGIRRIRRDAPSIDILVNNAGIKGASGFFQLTSLAQLRETFEVNYFSVAFITQLVLRVMRGQKSGCIINMASTAGYETDPVDLAYGTSKAAVIAFTRILAVETAGIGVRVNAVAPGPVATDMFQGISEEARAHMLQNVAMGRPAEPEEVARAVRFLASEDASFITGQILTVNGGTK